MVAMVTLVDNYKPVHSYWNKSSHLLKIRLEFGLIIQEAIQ